MSLLRDVLWAAIPGSLASAVAAGSAAQVEGRGSLQPLDATSHWLHGRNAGSVRQLDLPHTGVGVLTHVASGFFWAVPFSIWLRRRPEQIIVGGLRAAVAAAVDYLVVPRRLTTGWELTLSRRGIAGTFAGLALGLAGGALISRFLRD